MPFEFEMKLYEKLWKRNYKKDMKLLDFWFKKFKVKKVLDVACGTGKLDLFLSKIGYKVLGIDTSDEALRIAKKRLNQNFSVIKLDALNISKLKQKFDAIICMGNSLPVILTTKKKVHDFFSMLKNLSKKLVIIDCKCKNEIHESTWLERPLRIRNKLILPIFSIETKNKKTGKWIRVYLILQKENFKYLYFESPLRCISEKEIKKVAKEVGLILIKEETIGDRSLFVFSTKKFARNF